MKNRRIGIFLISLGAAALNCVNLAGGNGSETTNGLVVGQLLEDNGSPAAETRVMFVAGNHDPVKDGPVPDSLTDTTDEAGRFRFRAAGGATFNIEGFQPGSGNRALITGITVPVNDTDYIPACTMQKPGAITCFLTPPDSFNGYIYIPGTTRYAEIIRGNAVIDSVPPGFISTIRYSGTVDPSGGRVVASDLTVFTGNTVVIADSFVWKYSKRFQLNTTGSGAGVSGAVLNFPALIRLNADNFDFSQARAEGGDLRFAKMDGTTLPYEIERWDPVTGLAEMWVKIDTIYGNDSTRFFTMYWGNSNIATMSDPAAVFDTAAGFAGVWHLERPSGSIVPDATANGNDGTAMATTTAAGAVGMAQLFNGTSSLIRASGPAVDKLNFPENGTFSVSAWVKTNVLDSIFHGVVYKSNVQYGLQMRPKNRWEFVTFIDQTRWEMSRAPASDDSWHALVGVRNGSKQYLYVDGVCADSSVAIQSTNLARIYDQPLEIGHCPDGGDDPDRYFNGLIDEVRISKTAYGADWVKLCYMNQKQQDAVVKFK